MSDDLQSLRHDHHGCALCKRQRNWAADRIEQRLREIGSVIFRTHPMFASGDQTDYYQRDRIEQLEADQAEADDLRHLSGTPRTNPPSFPDANPSNTRTGNPEP